MPTRRGALAALAAGLVTAALLPSPAAAASARPAAVALPADRLHFGLSNDPDSLGWMTASGVPWKYRYAYLAGGVDTGSGWQTWQDPALPPGQYALDYMRNSRTAGYIPVLTYYLLLQSHPGTGLGESDQDFANLNRASLMATYYGDFKVLMQRASQYGGQVVVHVEPDLWGYLEQRAGVGGAGALTAQVGGTGFPDLAGYPDTVPGFAQGLLHLRDLYAPNALLAIHASMWGSGVDVASSTDAALDAAGAGGHTAAFLNSVGVTSNPRGSTWDLVFHDVDDHDAGWWEATGATNQWYTHWWDRANARFPNFSRWLTWVAALHAQTGKPQVAWQVPMGNQYYLTENNRPGHYQDNVLEYMLAHPVDLWNAGIQAVLLGRGNADQSTNEDAAADGVTNNGGVATTDAAGGCSACNNHPANVADDDGGYARVFVGRYYSAPWPPAPAASGVLHPLPPARVIDTRQRLGGLSRLAPGQHVEAALLGQAGIPTSGVAAIVLNITTDAAQASGWVAVYPGGTQWPGNSNLNYGTAQPSTNLVEAQVGPNGRVAFANGSAGGVELIADVSGWISDTPAGPAGRLRPVPPARILDTRASRPLAGGPGNALTLTVAGRGGLPATGISAAVLNLTVTNPSAAGFLAVYPAGTPYAGSSNLNFVAGQTIPNRVIVPLAGGAISILSSVALADVVVDVGGWFSDGSDPAASGGAYTPSLPTRILDTRAGIGALGPGGVYRLAAGGAGGAPASGVTAVVLNVTAAGATAPSFVAVYPDGSSYQVTSDLNTDSSRVSTNLVIVKLGSGGVVDLFNSSGSVELVVDLLGWYS